MFQPLVLLLLIASTVHGLLQSPGHQYNVSAPTPGSPYVIGQKLPLIYTIADNTTADNLKLSIVLQNIANPNNSITIVADATLAKAFSYQTQVDGATVYKHQYDYNIPSNAVPGEYNVIYQDSVTNSNVSVSVMINTAVAAVTPPAGTGTASGNNPQKTGSIFLPNGSASGPRYGMLLLALGCIAPLLVFYA
ncbi:hypothetical protein DFQ28_009909 [Apophysomyces sp. BC1034]|nr:hypothetical protein DFQ30_009557 [Apophysomyces sp. BC1015]KAG0172101.1 hypothetical protein DFQ29_008526 [Apophysomyces sp. BC1021]KAG0185128.1 hypothetical protein DFQ28_009909 [Apophysomyces sp. BC1034]